MTVGAPNLREVNCQVKSSSDIFISVLCQLNKLESVQWNWSPSSWVHSVLLAVRLHLAVNSDSSWAVRHISFSGYSHKKTLCLFVSLQSFLSFSFPVCLQLWLSASVAPVWFIMSCIRPQQAVGVYTKPPSELTIPLFIPWRRENSVRCSPFEGVVGEPWPGGAFS